MQFFTTYRAYILVAIGVSIALVAWWSLSSSDQPSNSALTAQDSASVAPGEKNIVDTLLQLRAVSLSGTIFSNPAFSSLRDFGTEIVPEPIGRPNPFAPYVPGATRQVSTSTQPSAPPQS